MILVFVAAAITGLVVSAAIVWLVARYGAHVGLLDVPNERSHHTASTPRGGGVGILAGVAAGILVFSVFGMPPTRPLGWLLTGAATMAALGAMDDIRSIRARIRLMVQLAVAIVVVGALGPVPRLPLPAPLDLPLYWLAWPLTILWLMGVTNFYNFMDGIDGLAGGQAIVSCIGVVIAGWSAQALQFAVMLAASTAGFLVFNRPPARVFLGDVGSTSLGFGIAAMPLLAPASDRPMAVLAVAIGLSLFLLDPLETLLRLVRAGHKLGVAHRMHSYQRLASANGPGLVAAAVVVCGLALSIGGAIAYRAAWAAWAAWLLIAVALCAYAVERFAARMNVATQYRRQSSTGSKPRLAIITGPDAASRWPLVEVLARDFEVALVGSKPQATAHVSKYFEYKLERSISPIGDLLATSGLLRILLKIRPDVVHTFSTKPSVLGRLAARMARVPVITGTIPGIGSLYGDNRIRTRLIRYVYECLQKAVCRLSAMTVFQNDDDLAEFVARRLVSSKRAMVIPGSGVDTAVYRPDSVSAEEVKAVRNELGIPPSALVVTMISRVIKSKGVCDFADAAQLLSSSATEAPYFLLVGSLRRSRPRSWSCIPAIGMCSLTTACPTTTKVPRSCSSNACLASSTTSSSCDRSPPDHHSVIQARSSPRLIRGAVSCPPSGV